MINPNPPKASKPSKSPKPTAAERKVAQAAIVETNRLLLEKQREEFVQERPKVWALLFVKVLRLKLLTDENPYVLDDNSWWFDSFRVDARNASFATEHFRKTIGEADLNFADVERVNEELDNALEWVTDFLAEQERKRLEAIEQDRLRKLARAKLTDEEAILLGVR